MNPSIFRTINQSNSNEAQTFISSTQNSHTQFSTKQDYDQRNYPSTKYQYNSGPKYSTLPSTTLSPKHYGNQTNRNQAKISNKLDGFTTLSSFARQVKQPIIQRDQQQKGFTQNSNDKYGLIFNKYANNSNKDPKMAASAIIGTSNQEDGGFNRFPAFNLDLGSNKEQKGKNPNTSALIADKPAETAKEKRERQILEIKKQLDDLNKKMNQNSQKNKELLGFESNRVETRPAKNAMISQSAIFEQQPVFNGSETREYFQQPVNTGKKTLTLEQLYSKKTNKVDEKKDRKGSFEEQKHNDQYKFSSPYITSQNKNKPFSKQQKQYPSALINKTQVYQQKKQIFNQQSDQKNITSINSGLNITEQKKNMYQYDYTQKKPSTTAPYVPLKAQPYTYQNVYVNKSGETQNKNKELPKYQFKSKPAQIVQINVQPNTKSNNGENANIGDFKKKKMYVAQTPIEISKPSDYMKMAKYPHSETKNQHEKQHFILKRTDSSVEEDPNSPPIELKNFKVEDFVIGKKMGKGQFGQVMLVRHKLTGWVCGLKVMNKKDIKDQDYVGQIARELSIQFYLQHRNIAQLYGYFQDQKNFYLLIQFCTGGQLLQKLKVERRMNQKDVSMIIRQVCEGIDHIHKQQIIHRDIKPENILFNMGTVKISDFGWAVYRGFGMRRTASGSPLYYPPQIVKGESYDDKIDIWCVGMMTYECIMGKIPFRVYTQLDLGRIVSDEITFPEWVDVSDEAKDFILKTMKKKGEERLEVKKMLRHPFITKYQQNQMNSLSPTIIEQFRRVLN